MAFRVRPKQINLATMDGRRRRDAEEEEEKPCFFPSFSSSLSPLCMPELHAHLALDNCMDWSL